MVYTYIVGYILFCIVHASYRLLCKSLLKNFSTLEWPKRSRKTLQLTIRETKSFKPLFPFSRKKKNVSRKKFSCPLYYAEKVRKLTLLNICSHVYFMWPHLQTISIMPLRRCCMKSYKATD